MLLALKLELKLGSSACCSMLSPPSGQGSSQSCRILASSDLILSWPRRRTRACFLMNSSQRGKPRHRSQFCLIGRRLTVHNERGFLGTSSSSSRLPGKKILETELVEIAHVRLYRVLSCTWRRGLPLHLGDSSTE